MSRVKSYYTDSTAIIEGEGFVPRWNYTVTLYFHPNTKTVKVTFGHFNIGRDFEFLESSQAGAMQDLNRYITS